MTVRKKRRQPAPQPPQKPGAAPAPARPTRWGWRERTVLALLAVLVLVAFAPVVGNDFVSYDDRSYITENPHVRSGLTEQGIYWGLTTLHHGAAATWHPLVWWSLMLDAQIYGADRAAGFHITNLLWHLGSTLLLFAALRRLTGSLWPSALVATLFAVHPLNVEPVAWVSERKGILSTFFWMLSLYLYARYVERPSLGRYLLVVLAFVLGLMSKPMLVTLPFVFLLLDFWPLGRLRIGKGWWVRLPNRTRHESCQDGNPNPQHGKATPTEGSAEPTSLPRLLMEKLPLLALSAVFCVITVISQSKAGAISSLESLPLTSRLELAVMSYLAYLEGAFYPVHLAACYPIGIENYHPAQVIATAAVLLIVSGILLWQARRVPYLAVGWLWFVGTLVPVIGLVQIGNAAVSDRYAYIPLVGLLIAVSWSLQVIAQRWHCPRAATGLTVLVVGSFMVLSARQARVWRNTDTLWEHALEVTPNNYVAHNNLAVEFQKRNQMGPALAHFEEALRIKPAYTYALNGKGQCLMAQGQLPQAITWFQEAIRYDPSLAMSHLNLGAALGNTGAWQAAADEFREVLRQEPDSPEAQLNLARALLRLNQPQEAAAQFRIAMSLQPNPVAVLPELGRAYQLSGDWQQAEGCFRRLVALQPSQATYHRELALCLSHRGQSQQAREAYQEALRLNPNWPATDQSRAWRLATDRAPAQRWGPMAVLMAERVVAVKGDDAQALDTLAAAYAESGRFEEAVRTATRASQQARAAAQTGLAGEIEARLHLYEKRQPYHAP